MKNYFPSGKYRTQKYDTKTRMLAPRMATWIGKEGKFTTHSFRRSTGTALDESVIISYASCHAGRYKSHTVAERHTEHSNIEKIDRCDRLDYGPVSKMPKHENQNVIASNKAPGSLYVPIFEHDNNTCTSFDGFKGGSI